LVRPVRGSDYFVDTLAQTDTADAQIIRSNRVRLHKVSLSDLNRIESKLFRNLVNMNFERESRLRRAVPPLRSTRRFVSEHAQAFELVAWHIVGHRLKRPRVERARDAVTAVRAAVQKRPEVHRGDCAVILRTGLDPHQNGMPAAMTVEDFLASERDLHRTAGYHRKLGDDDLVIERIAFATETTAVGSRDHSDVTGGHLEHLRQRAMNVVRRLSGAPQGELFIGIKYRNCRLLLHRQMSVAFVEEQVLANQVRFRESRFDGAEFERDLLVNISAVSVFVDARLGRIQRVID